MKIRKKMEEVKLDNLVSYKKGFAFAKALSITAILVSVIVPVGSLLYVSSVLKEMKSVIYVMKSDGSSEKAIAYKEEDVREFKFRDAVHRAYKYSYAFNEYNYESRMEMARHFFDKASIESIENEHKRTKLLTNIKTYNTVVDGIISKKDIIIDMSAYPVTGKLTAMQVFRSGGKSVTKLIKAEFKVVSYAVSDDNPNGAKIIDWNWEETLIDE